MSDNGTHNGGCLCGKSRYQALGVPVNVRVCHCRLCQKAIGAPFNARALFRGEDVRFEGPIRRFNSSDDLERLFCEACGTTVASHRISRDWYGLTLASLDDPAAFAPDCHFWTDSKLDWVETGGLPTYREAAPL